MDRISVIEGRPDPQDRVLEIVGGPMDGRRMAVGPGVLFRETLLIPVSLPLVPHLIRGPLDEASESARSAVAITVIAGVRLSDGVVLYRWVGVREA